MTTNMENGDGRNNPSGTKTQIGTNMRLSGRLNILLGKLMIKNSEGNSLVNQIRIRVRNISLLEIVKHRMENPGLVSMIPNRQLKLNWITWKSMTTT